MLAGRERNGKGKGRRGCRRFVTEIRLQEGGLTRGLEAAWRFGLQEEGRWRRGCRGGGNGEKMDLQGGAGLLGDQGGGTTSHPPSASSAAYRSHFLPVLDATDEFS